MGNGPNNQSLKSEKRFDDTLERRAAAIPGPGQYDPKTEVNSQGAYFLDRLKNSCAPIFTKQQRLVTLDPSETRKITPGPGTYRAPSEFGYYEVSNLNNILPSQSQSLLTSKKSLS